MGRHNKLIIIIDISILINVGQHRRDQDFTRAKTIKINCLCTLYDDCLDRSQSQHVKRSDSAFWTTKIYKARQKDKKITELNKQRCVVLMFQRDAKYSVTLMFYYTRCIPCVLLVVLQTKKHILSLSWWRRRNNRTLNRVSRFATINSDSLRRFFTRPRDHVFTHTNQCIAFSQN